MGQSSSLLFFIAIVAVFYFLIIRPQKQRQKDHAELLRRLEPGAEILTIGGLYGTIDSIDDERVRIVVADGSTLEFARDAIAQLIEPVTDDEGDAGQEGEGERADVERADEDEDDDVADDRPDDADV